MPIINRQDAAEVEEHIKRIFDAQTSNDRAHATRGLFTQVLDFDMTFDYEVGLEDAAKGIELPGSAELVAQLDGVDVVYVDMSQVDKRKERVLKTEVQETARLISRELGEDLLMVFSNGTRSQLHFVLPSFSGKTIALRRMIIERDLPRRTAVQQLSNIYWEWKSESDIRAALESAFDVEKVTRDFFNEYKTVFENAKQLVTGFEGDDEAKNLFVQTVFNRLMFIYFTSRKGWLRFDGRKDYLNALWRSYASDGDQTNFYTDRLTHLFFAGLNNPASRDLMGGNSALSSVVGDVPFLNGGLFDKEDHDNRSEVVVPDDAIEPIFRDLFDRFNFTVMESTPLDVEVAVDPEMLGKVFEELVTGRHESGSYYTPRRVVSFMCREGLKGYLDGKNTGLSEDAIAAFVDERDTSGISLAEAQTVSHCLSEVTVVDPACGSGAYLLGMMQELVDLQSALYSDQLREDARSLYQVKLGIIERNLHGADVDEFAVNIAMLRLWLSLVIEYEGDHPEPLPNLNYKIVCGDSLLGPDPSPENGADFYRHLTEQLDLRGKKARYMRASEYNAKRILRHEIESAEDQIRKTMGDATLPDDVINWPIDFAEVFALHGGFDIVVANPPYVAAIEFTRTRPKWMRNAIKDAFYSAKGAWDLFVPFYERSVQLLNRTGLVAFITPNKILSAPYAKMLRQFLHDKGFIASVTDVSSIRIFPKAAVNPVISVFRKDYSQPSSINAILPVKRNSEFDPNDFISNELDQEILTLLPDHIWGFLLSPRIDLLTKLVDGADTLSDLGTVQATSTASESGRIRRIFGRQSTGGEFQSREHWVDRSVHLQMG